MIRVLSIVVLENCVTTNLLALQICTANRKKSSIQTLGGDVILNHLHDSCYAHVLNLVLHKQTKLIEFLKLLPPSEYPIPASFLWPSPTLLSTANDQYYVTVWKSLIEGVQ